MFFGINIADCVGKTVYYQDIHSQGDAVYKMYVIEKVGDAVLKVSSKTLEIRTYDGIRPREPYSYISIERFNVGHEVIEVVPGIEESDREIGEFAKVDAAIWKAASASARMQTLDILLKAGNLAVEAHQSLKAGDRLCLYVRDVALKVFISLWEEMGEKPFPELMKSTTPRWKAPSV